MKSRVSEKNRFRSAINKIYDRVQKYVRCNSLNSLILILKIFRVEFSSKYVL